MASVNMAEVSPPLQRMELGVMETPQSLEEDSTPSKARFKEASQRLLLARRLSKQDMHAATRKVEEFQRQEAAKAELSYETTNWMRVLRPKYVGASRFVLLPWAFITILCFIIEGFDQLHARLNITPTVPTTLGALMSLLLAFRVNASFERWWEARKLWGDVIVSTRNLMVQLLVTCPPPELSTVRETAELGKPEDASRGEQATTPARAAAWCLGFAVALRQRRSTSKLRAIRASQHPPLYTLLQLRMALEEHLQRRGRPGIEQKLLESADTLTSACTGCERILRTPCPPGYVGVLRAVMSVWLIFLPLALVQSMGMVMVPIVSVTAFLILAVEQLAVQIENPFNDDINDLPLVSFCLTIEADLLRLMQEGGHAYADLSRAISTAASTRSSGEQLLPPGE